MTAPVAVTGFLGAGKSTVAEALGKLGIDADEHDPLSVPSAVGPIIAVADAANLQRCLKNDLAANLVRAQIGAACLVVVSRGDLTDPGPAKALIAEITDAPIVEAPNGAISADALEHLAEGPLPEAVDLRSEYAEWSYEGGARLQQAGLQRLTEQRPPGLYRLAGVVRVDAGAVEVEIAGQVRQTRPCSDPGETTLRAIGPKSVFDPGKLDVQFAELAADGAFRAGFFGYR